MRIKNRSLKASESTPLIDEDYSKDASGNSIPESSEKSNTKSSRGWDATKAKELAELRRENATLREKVEHYQSELRLSPKGKVDPAAVRRTAKKLAYEYLSTYDVDEAAKKKLPVTVTIFFNYIILDISSKTLYYIK